VSTATPTRLPKINDTGTGPTPAAHPTAPKLVEPAPTFFDPTLTPGQRQILTAELPRLFRMIARGKYVAVVDLLDDLAGQAPAVDKVLAAETQRRRDTAAARPTLALTLGRNRRT
jgi:hypothetical protein